MTHVHDILDSDKRFSIDPITRAITNESENKVMVMQYDHNSERFTFELPRLVEGHDMSLSTVAQVHYLNGTNSGVYETADLQISPDDPEKVIFSWLISRNATMNSTTLTFLIKFRCYEDEKVVYEWNTAKFEKISVGAGMDGGEVIVEEYPDYLADWESRIVALEEGGADEEMIEAAVNKYLDANPIEMFETDESLILANGVLSVNSAKSVEQDNTLPVTSGAVFTEIGNIETILKAI